MIKRVSKIISKIINSIWFPIIIGIIILIKTMFFYSVTIETSGKVYDSTFWSTVGFIIVPICLICMLPNKVRTIGIIVIDVCSSILLFANNIYYIYSSSILSIAQISNLQYTNEILGAFPTLLRENQIIYFIDFIFLILLFLIKEVKIEENKKVNKKVKFARMISGVAGIIILYIACIPSVSQGNEESYNKDMLIKNCTIYGYYVYDIKNAIMQGSNSKYKNKKEMQEDYNTLMTEYEEKYGEKQYNLEGYLKGKNIIIVQLESLQNFLVNKEINGKEILPRINEFLKENIEFTDMHMQSYTTTADSEHSTINSLYPIENGMAFTKYYTNTYDDIFKVLHNNDYYTSYMHGNEYEFWNRGNLYGRLEIDDLALKDKFDDYEYINGFLSDELLYLQGIEKLKTYQKPFFSFIVSASSHNPYELEGLQDRSKISIDVGKYKGTHFGNYLEAANYADYAFGVFIDKLKENNLYDNTAILVFGDHNGLSMYDEDMIEYLEEQNSILNDTDLKLNFSNVLFGLKIPGINEIKITKPVSKLDIKPTLCFLCGIEDGFSLGTNMFENKDFVCINNDRIVTDKYFYAEGWFERKTGNEIDLEKIDPELENTLETYYEYMKKELNISNSIIVNNLLKK